MVVGLIRFIELDETFLFSGVKKAISWVMAIRKIGAPSRQCCPDRAQGLEIRYGMSQ